MASNNSNDTTNTNTNTNSNSNTNATAGDIIMAEAQPPSPRNVPTNQDQNPVTVPAPMPTASTLEIGGSSSVPSPSKLAAGTTDQVGGGSSAVAPVPIPVPATTVAVAADASAPPVPLRNIVGSGTEVIDLTVDDEDYTEGSSKKLVRTEDMPGGQSSCMPVPKRARGEMDAPQGEPKCSICSRKFSSWKAVFGHMRAHPGREWRGAFPPPTGDWSPERPAADDQRQDKALQSQLAPTLLDIARETLDKMNEDPNPSGGAAATAAAGTLTSSAQNRGRFDLNAEPNDPGMSSSSSSEGFDLNKPPKKDGNEGSPI